MKYAARGFSLIQLLIALAILGVLLAVGASGFRVWIANMRIRTSAEAIQNGLQLARGEAVRRNAQIGFHLTNNLTATCALSMTDSNWVVSYDNPAGACNAALLNEDFAVDNAISNPPPRILQVRTGAEGSRNVVVAADQSTITFNGLGRVTPTPGTNPITINVSPDPAVGSCPSLRCLRVTVTVGGQIRMCDPQLSLSSPTDPQSC